VESLRDVSIVRETKTPTLKLADDGEMVSEVEEMY
jgi:hypothetical protein